jgi:hypothetical protein
MNHNETVIVLRSLTHSIKAKRLLWEHGIAARVVKPDAGKSEKGCGYGVAVPSTEGGRALKMLEENGIPVSESKRL